jgi:predicted HicB family RNase H-like nuclease
MRKIEMSNDCTLSHRGYLGSVNFDLDEKVLYGRVLFINDVISYGGESLVELEENFRSALDGYLNLCAEKGISADKPFSGTFNVRIGEQRHKQCALHAAKYDISINEVIAMAVDKFFEAPQEIRHVSNYFILQRSPQSVRASTSELVRFEAMNDICVSGEYNFERLQLHC